ncbi:MAG: hypothetical protein SF162_08145 [bacterium]|nr:hypothetical protein [bacterium]
MSKLQQAVGQGGRLAALFVFLLSIYMVTYSARIETGDTRLFFDGLTSLVDYGDVRLDLAAWFRFPTTIDPAEPLPLRYADVEPLILFAAAPLYLLATLIPGVGLVHVVWLFNPITAALTGCLFYRYARLLGWRTRTALLGAILLGVGTAIFPYTRTFFREVLALFLLLAACFSIEKLRQGGYRQPLWWGLALIAVIGTILTKVSMFFAFPALIVLGLPSIQQISRRTIVIGCLVAAGVIGVALLLGQLPFFGGRYDALGTLLGGNRRALQPGLNAYLFSPGGSFWGTSPILLMGIPGCFLLIRRGKSRYPLAVAALVIGFAFGYAFLNGEQWFGGLSWPPRFLIPIIPVCMIVTLPALDALIDRRPFTVWHGAALVLIAYTLWVQLSGVTLDLGAYPENLPPESGGYIEWLGGLYDPRWFRWAVIPSLWGTYPFDFLWVALDLPLWGMGFAGAAIAAGLWIARPVVSTHVGAVLVTLVFIMIAVGLLTAAPRDERFGAGDRAAFDAIRVLEAETTRTDVVLLSNPRYELFFHNYGRWQDAARMISLPPQPGDQPSPEQPAEVASAHPASLLTRYTIPFLHSIAAHHDRMWLLVDGTPELAWSIRPVERYLSSRYYPLRYFQVGDFVRLVEYSTVPAPDPFAFANADTPTDLVFGGTIRLIGVQLPVGNTFQPGDALPVSLQWVTDAPLEARYTVALYLRDANGAPIAQHDYPPAGGFAPTDGWQPGGSVWDHRALRLPLGLPAGTYQLWVKLYSFAPDGTVQDSPVSGNAVLDGVIGILPVVITVAA